MSKLQSAMPKSNISKHLLGHRQDPLRSEKEEERPPPLWVAGKWAKVEIAQKNAWKILSFVENALKIRRFLDDFRLEKDDFRLSIEGKHGVFFRNLIFRYPLVTQHHYGKIHHVLPGESITNGHVLS